jgi:hypothetical protein
MKREEIINMLPGKEMNDLITKYVFGGTHPYLISFLDRCGEIDHVSPPNYSTDISAAWKVVEKITTPGAANVNFYWWWKGADVHCMSSAEAAHAICRAALLLVMELED